MSNRILFIMPTRARHWAAMESIASIKKTANRPNDIDICLCQDNDDPIGILKIQGSGIGTMQGERMRFVQWVNHALGFYSLRVYSHVAWAADDVRFRTQGWDDMVQERSELVVYGTDGIRNHPTHPFIRVAIPLTLGYLLPNELVHQFSDTFINYLSKEIPSIFYDERIVTEHLHYTVSKAARDQNYADSEATYQNDRRVFHEVVVPRIPDLAEKMRAKLSTK